MNLFVIDSIIEQSLFSLQTPLGVAFASFITDFAGATVVIAISILAVVILHNGKRWDYASGLLLSVEGSAIAATLLKLVVQRPRPPLYMHAVTETSYSFPSSHAAVAIALYGFLIFSAEHLILPRWRKIGIIFCSALVIAIGFSRLYLGVHYLSDVLGGYILGAVFLWLGIRLTNFLSRFINE